MNTGRISGKKPSVSEMRAHVQEAKDDLNRIIALLLSLQESTKEVSDKSMPLERVLTLLIIAYGGEDNPEEIPNPELINTSGLADSTVSNHTQELGARGRVGAKTPGLGFIHTWASYLNNRIKLHKLTDAGVEVLYKAINAYRRP